MNEGPMIKGNPLKISIYSLLACYFLGEFVFPKYPLIYLINLLGVIVFIVSIIIFCLGFNIFKSYKENPIPTSISRKLIKTGIFSYTRNPIYLSFVMFHFSMFMVFENVMYLLTAFGLAIWIHNYIIRLEEEYLLKNFSKEYENYMTSVSRWIFF